MNLVGCRAMVGKLANEELGRIWTEVVVAIQEGVNKTMQIINP
jgi:hypothetical protein